MLVEQLELEREAGGRGLRSHAGATRSCRRPTKELPYRQPFRYLTSAGSGD
jgi:hypothetical protein